MFSNYDFLEDAIDLHIHVGPDYVKRYGDSIQIAQEASNKKMRAVIIKTHLCSTVAAAYAATRVVDGIDVFGGIALNEPNGGFNLRNVYASILSGAKMIWLPTVDAEYAIDKANKGHWIRHYVNSSTFGYPRQGLSILNSDGVLIDEVNEILRLCKENNVILGTGHISPNEALCLSEESKRISFRKLEVTHPNAWLEDFSIDVLKKLTQNGATITLSYGVCSPHNGGQNPKEIVSVINQIGPQHCALITDYGQTTNPSPVEGFRVFCQMLTNLGVNSDDMRLMAKINPGKLLYE